MMRRLAVVVAALAALALTPGTACPPESDLVTCQLDQQPEEICHVDDVGSGEKLYTDLPVGVHTFTVRWYRVTNGVHRELVDSDQWSWEIVPE